jgi:hypothetical protein
MEKNQVENIFAGKPLATDLIEWLEALIAS